MQPNAVAGTGSIRSVVWYQAARRIPEPRRKLRPGKDACRPFFAHFRRSTKSKLCFRPRMKPLPGLFYKENGGTLAFVAPSASCRAWGLRMLHCGTPQESLKRRWLQHFLVEKIYGHQALRIASQVRSYNNHQKPIMGIRYFREGRDTLEIVNSATFIWTTSR